MLNRKLIFGLVALIGFGLFVTMNAFTSVKKSVTLKYQYTGPNYAGTTTLSNWTQISDESNPEECDGQTIPCTIQFDDSQYANMAAYLAVHNTPSLVDDDDFVTSKRD